ncbi:hypothetical protein Hamer_G018402 [Homarus americanus]|uniref:Uncharacterized protein n=1 Tax=Homarus americanus TaxID=6706 RepID=A0A8J5K0N9_HOMAM|nr:hypothetical protein Hamer_G018402 [Homarus americanus]
MVGGAGAVVPEEEEEEEEEEATIAEEVATTAGGTEEVEATVPLGATGSLAAMIGTATRGVRARRSTLGMTWDPTRRRVAGEATVRTTCLRQLARGERRGG